MVHCQMKMSHLLQMRGLKQHKKELKIQNFVASFTDAWIETVILVVNIGGCEVASFTDAWIETIQLLFCDICDASHLLQMRGLKPRSARNREGGQESHLLQMRGLKPLLITIHPFRTKSHLLQMRGLKLPTEHLFEFVV